MTLVFLGEPLGLREVVAMVLVLGGVTAGAAEGVMAGLLVVLRPVPA
jgi:hypothetical protein